MTPRKSILTSLSCRFFTLRRSDLRYIHLALLALLSLPVISCQGDDPKDDDGPAEKISSAPPPRASNVTLDQITFPDGKGGYFTLSANDFVNGHYAEDIIALAVPPSFNIEAEENNAATNSIFVAMPGFKWTVSHPQPVTIKLTTRGVSQKIQRNARETGAVTVSLMAFDQIFPPIFRENYELSINTLAGVPHPFSFTYTFAVRRSSTPLVHAVVTDRHGPNDLPLGKGRSDFLMAKISTSATCDICAIDIVSTNIVATVKTFTELPAIPQPTRSRISLPARFSGLLTSQKVTALKPLITGNNTSEVFIRVSVPSSLSTIPAWCQKSQSPPGQCVVIFEGRQVPTYFGFLNSVPADKSVGMLGGTGGIASLRISGEATVVVRRDGIEVERKVVPLDSRDVSPLDSPTLPSWSIDLVRNALFSGAPEFQK